VKIGKRQIDHIVYAVPNLEDACQELESALGVKPVFGGYHKTKGTKNALLNLGDSCYLEILAVDESNKEIEGARWMGVDLIKKPCITRWAIKSDNLPDDQLKLQMYHADMGEIFGGSRQTPNGDLLEWNMILPLAAPEIELAPFMVHWSKNSIHPTENLTQICPLVSIEFRHNNPTKVQHVFDELGLEQNINKGSETDIKIQIKAASGEIVSLR